MAYKILYVEDLDPGTIVHELKSQGFEADHYNPESLDELMKRAKEYDLLLLDFRLTENRKIIFDAPTIAQTIRTVGGTAHLDIPIVLMSTEEKITDYYRDFSSHDLFDYSVKKQTFLENLEKYAGRFNSAIEAYRIVAESGKDLEKCLGISAEFLKSLDYRISEQLSTETYSQDVFAFTSYVLKQIIRSIGVLIGEDVLLARLGISKKSKEWQRVVERLEPYRYRGIFSNSYSRWWSQQIEQWWKSEISEISLRRLTAQKRVDLLKEKLGLTELIQQEKTAQATSSNYWTICKQLNAGIDSIDGLELHQRDIKPWQEKEYISIQAGLESSPLNKYVKPYDRERLKDIVSKLK